MIEMSDKEFSQFQRFIYDAAGITLPPTKKQLVCGRLSRRLRHHALESFSDYLILLLSNTKSDEAQIAIDLLTTNETSFFREPQHFDFLQKLTAEADTHGQTFRVWSAACSSGEEPYSIAMVLAENLREQAWEVLGSDISTQVLNQASHGLYPHSRIANIPLRYLQQYCLRGIGPQSGTVLMGRALRQHIQFCQINLNDELPGIGSFDVIFLRNAMIYFSSETKQKIIARVTAQLKPGGYFLIGHAETLNGLSKELKPVLPAVYRKSGGGQSL